jgi:hypothetical protein
MTPEDQILERLEEAFSKAFNNPKNNSLEKVIAEVKQYGEFKDLDIDAFLMGTARGLHSMDEFPFDGGKTQVIIVDKDRQKNY